MNITDKDDIAIAEECKDINNKNNISALAHEDIVKKLITIWRELLQIDDVNPEDNFYRLGGNSLKAAALEIRAESEFSVQLSLEDIMQNVTIEKLASYIAGLEKSDYKSIERVEPAEYYPLSASQKSIYITSQHIRQKTGFNLPIIRKISGDFHKDRLEKAFISLIKRHEAFRTSFHSIQGELVQQVHEEAEFKLHFAEADETEVDGIVRAFIRPFELDKAPLLRAKLIKLAQEKFVLAIDMHHIIADGTSMGILMEELSAIYDGWELPPLRIQYKDYSVWQKNIQDTKYIIDKKQYWLEKLNGQLPSLDLPYDRLRTPEMKYKGEAVCFDLSAELVEKLNELAYTNNCTLHAALFSAYSLLVSRYSGQQDIIIGSISAGRNYAELENIVGVFINVLPIRIRFDIDITFIKFMELVRAATLGAYANQDYTFDMIMNELTDIPNDSRYLSNPLFGTMFVFHNEIGTELEFNIGDMKCEGYALEKFDSNMDIQVDMFIADNGAIHCRFEYDSQVFDKKTIERMAGHFGNILSEIMDSPEKCLYDIQMISEAEKNQLVYGFNNTKQNYIYHKPLHILFEEQAERVPENIAVSYENTHITYYELNKEANRIARYLKKEGLENGSIVGLLMKRSPSVLASILAIWKTGSAYMPIDPNFPEERIAGILEDSGVSVLIAETACVPAGLELKYKGTLFYIDLNNEELKAEAQDNLNEPVGLDSLAYVLYTSGSTGKPKGVMIEHLGMLNHTNIMIKHLAITEDSVIAQNASYCFDISVWQLTTALAVGAAIMIYPDSLIINPKSFIDRIISDKVSILEVVPSFLNVILDLMEEDYRDLASLKYLILTGEMIKLSIVERWFSMYKGAKVVNAYGPAEASDDVTFYIMDNCDNMDRMLIGEPLDNITVYIVDKNMNLCPIGVVGEICISGISVGRGYLNDIERTSKAFVEDPFSAQKGIRMYKTGDLGRWTEDGSIEYSGRIDYQVKVRGFRIELGEIENMMLHYKTINEAVVIDREDNEGNKYLCAYYHANEVISTEELRAYLAQTLPEYMVPAQLVQLEEMPVLINGKIDRKALKDRREEAYTGEAYVKAETLTAQSLENIWKAVLNKQNIGINDNFFVLGGNSLKAIALVSKVQQQMNIEIPISEIFKSPTISGMERFIINSQKTSLMPIERVEERAYYEVSSAQKRIYILSNIDPDSTGYNIPLAYVIEGSLKVDIVQEVLHELTRRHESLRTYFVEYAGEVYQVIDQEARVEFSYSEADEHAVDEIIRSFYTVFELDKAPLLKVGLIKLSESKHIMLWNIHHIISDAKSNIILINEFTKLYNGEKLSAQKIQYKDYAKWHNTLKNSDSMLKQEELWQIRFEDAIPELKLPLDYERPDIQSFAGDRLGLALENVLVQELNDFAVKHGVTMYMLLFAAYNVLIAHNGNVQDIVVGTPIEGRTHPDLEQVVGMFVNTLAIRSYPERDMEFISYLRDFKEALMISYDNQDYQFEDLVQKCKISRSANRNPIFDIAFSYADMEYNNHNKTLQIYDYPINVNISKFDMTLYAFRGEKSIYLEFEYCIALFKTDTIERFMQQYIKILETIVENSDIRIMDIELIEGNDEALDIGEIEFNFG